MLFKVKTKILTLRKPGRPPETKPMSSWMLAEKEYPVYDVMKFRTKTEDGNYHINTLFLVADVTSGRLDWVDASILLYIGEDDGKRYQNKTNRATDHSKEETPSKEIPDTKIDTKSRGEQKVGE